MALSPKTRYYWHSQQTQQYGPLKIKISTTWFKDCEGPLEGEYIAKYVRNVFERELSGYLDSERLLSELKPGQNSIQLSPTDDKVLVVNGQELHTV